MNLLKPPNEARSRASLQSQFKSDRVSLSRSPHPYHRHHVDIHQHGEDVSNPQSTSTESGTEADDEKGAILKGLPAPPLRARKGLRTASPRPWTPAASPVPTPPAYLHAESFFDFVKKSPEEASKDEEAKRDVYITRKRKELSRRITETLLLAVMSLLNFLQAAAVPGLNAWLPELILYVLLPPCVYLLYPVRRTKVAYCSGSNLFESLAQGFHIPSRFDPGPLLYPVVLPVLVALSLYEQSPSFLPVNIACGLASIPSAVGSIWSRQGLVWYLLWFISILPLHLSTLDRVLGWRPTPFGLKVGTYLTLDQCTLLFPLHQALKSVLEYLTATSLDPAELELLTTSLINLYVFAESPQSQILKAVLMVGGLAIFLLCKKLMVWEVELARIPKWKFAKQPQKNAMLYRIYHAFAKFMKDAPPAADSSDDEIDNRTKPAIKPLTRVKTLADPRLGRRSKQISPNGSAVEGILRFGRRNTISSLDPVTKQAVQRKAQRSTQLHGLQPSSFLVLTSQQAKIRKYLYAGIIYLVILTIIAFPVRQFVGINALYGQEPFGWAAGYLFGGIPLFRDLVFQSSFDSWIRLPQIAEINPPSDLDGLIRLLAQPANTRLVLCAYCIFVVALGIVAVLLLTSYVEVDTRRKVFHGVMVAMLLPTIFVDPCFFALALALILALFLLLDLCRASQLPPISRPLTNFLAPYVDGRDHRGPVIVSHIFLLIGCAIPLWLSLAAAPRTGEEPWVGWDTTTRDLSMISGVVCVGMGDAAASLIGRRYGRTKWYWAGGKSIEGSIAFAFAVTCGLMFAYFWLRLGGWCEWGKTPSSYIEALIKCIVAASGASLLESVLTAANDNVVVPIGLWLLVRGLKIA